MLSGVRRIRPEIVGWSTAPRGHVINKSLGQVPEKLVAVARVLARTESSPPIGYEIGWTTARSLGEVRTTWVHSNPVFASNDCTFLDEVHRAILEKKEVNRTRRTVSRLARTAYKPLLACNNCTFSRYHRDRVQKKIPRWADSGKPALPRPQVPHRHRVPLRTAVALPTLALERLVIGC
jgi:hypothetical protein